MAEEPTRDGWSKAQVILAAISGVLLPLVVAVVGGIYTYQQNQHNSQALDQQKLREQVSARAQQATQLLIHLASVNERERLLAIKVAEQLGKDDLLPRELAPVLIELASTDPSAAVSRAAAEAIQGTERVTTVASSGNITTQAFRPSAVLEAIPPRVYVHIRSEDQRPAARVLSSALEQAGFSVPGIQRVDVGPQHSELRYFEGSDQKDISGIEKALADAGVSVKGADLSAQYKDAKLRSRHYELWLSPDYLPKVSERR